MLKASAANGDYMNGMFITLGQDTTKQPERCFTAVLQDQNRDSHEPWFIMFAPLCVLSKYGAIGKIPNPGKAEINSRG